MVLFFQFKSLGIGKLKRASSLYYWDECHGLCFGSSFFWCRA